MIKSAKGEVEICGSEKELIIDLVLAIVCTRKTLSEKFSLSDDITVTAINIAKHVSVQNENMLDELHDALLTSVFEKRSGVRK